jgi:hypothetical protein
MRGVAVGVGLPFESERKKESGLVLMNTTDHFLFRFGL